MRPDEERDIKKIEKVRRKINQGRVINRDIVKVFIFFAALFIALIVFLGYFLTFRASQVINNSFNRRSDTLAKTVKRGSILADDLEALAYTITNEDGTESRIYPYSEIFAHVVGFDSKGRLGLESSYNYYLLTSHEGMFQKISNEFHQVKNAGDNIITSLNIGLQSYIYNILGSSDAAVICMNPETGQIYAMVSKPDFDPNEIDYIWDWLMEDEESSVLLNRTTQGLFTPGSTFKIFTLYEYLLEYPEMAQQFHYNCGGSIAVGDTYISCLYGAHGSQDLKMSFANSCNCAFSKIGMELDLGKFRTTARKLLFDTDLPVDISSYRSKFTLTADDTEFDIMATAMGQGNTQVTPLHLAMVVSAIANEGSCMKPKLVDALTDPYGNVIRTFKSSEYSRLFTYGEAGVLKEYLRAVVTDGTAQTVYPGNFVAYGKTGTAQKENASGEEFDHSWFVGWAENNGQKLVTCVILEDMDQAGTTAAYIAKLIFDYYFG